MTDAQFLDFLRTFIRRSAARVAKRITASALKGDMKLQLALLKLDEELFADNVPQHSGSEPQATIDQVELDILRDFLTGTGGLEDGVEEEDIDDGA